MKAGAAGGIEAVVKVVNTHVKDAGACFQGCAALSSMTANNGKIQIKT